MSKGEENLIMWGVIAIGAVLVTKWLESKPNCDRGCQNQLEHLKEHILTDALRAAFSQIAPLLG